MSDIWELRILHKNAKASHFHDVIEIGNICSMPKRKLFSDLQRTEVFDDILFYLAKKRFFCFVLLHLKSI